jgi:16S rRNA (adenine1518-N6/adenine1519-N6)-dimethyltransferase
VAWERMVFMFQLEVASRILGRPGTKDYGPLSILCQLCCRMTRLLKLGPGAFRPAPKVDSAVVVFEPLAGAPPLEARPGLLAFLFEAFGQRRKTLANNLHPRVAPARTREALATLGLPPDVRAEAIPPSAWCELHRVLV